MVQYVLYDDADVRRYRRLIECQMIPDGRHLVLFVLGRDSNSAATAEKLDDYVAALNNAGSWMACAFGVQAFDVLMAAAASGGHVRIGFENGWLLPDGSVAVDNESLVRAIAMRIRDCGRRVATVTEAIALQSKCATQSIAGIAPCPATLSDD